MRIYRMTATFGKLDHETLVLEPDFNIVQGENEWGKSTWCAFLMAMLYGLDTRAKSTKTVLADKDHYAPWSGSPMSGSMDICWRDRNITIERSSRGRIPMGEFRAFETETGVVVPELTGANCGQLLLGVEQSVFRRAGFIRFADLPVTQDDALRRRLNALVTTGDESGDAQLLERSLRELKNKCRYNRTGRIPQAEEERAVLENKLEERLSLDKQIQKTKTRLAEINQWVEKLENHQMAIRFAAAQTDADRIAQAEAAWAAAREAQKRLEENCAKLPSREQAERKIHQLRELQEQWHSVQMEQLLLPQSPACPEIPAAFAGMPLEEAGTMVQEDARRYGLLRKKKTGMMLFVIAAVSLALGGYMAVQGQYLYLGGLAALALVLLGFGIRNRKLRDGAIRALEEKYGFSQPEEWQKAWEACRESKRRYDREMVEYHTSRGDLDGRMEQLNTLRQSLCADQSAEKVLALWQQVMKLWDDCYAACREAQRAENHLQDLRAMAKSARRPAMVDTLTYTDGETARLLSDARMEQQHLQNRMGQYQGMVDALGNRTVLEEQLLNVNQRLKTLEDTYAAAELALETLAQAKRELQRRFAPRIAKRAQELLEAMTGGRYRRLSWGEDFSVSVAAEEENVLYSTLWRSDGTMDQLYLALRLAVAEALTADAPLILDDALVRFDDGRLKAALDILARISQHKQVLLFTCHSREKELYEKTGEDG